MTRQQHTFELARLLLSTLGQSIEQAGRRRRRELGEIVWMIQQGSLDDAGQSVRASGLDALVEHARDEHLARLGPDEGLLVLDIPWEHVLLAAHDCERARLNSRA